MKRKFPEWYGLNKKIRWARAQVPGFKDEEAFRAMLEEIGGSRSLAEMSKTGMARVVDHFAQAYGIEFEHSKARRMYASRAARAQREPRFPQARARAPQDAGPGGIRNETVYQAKAAGRRTDFYEIPDGPLAPRMRKILAIWKRLGYRMTSIDSRVKAQFGVEAFRWLTDEAMLDILARDLNKRLKRKEEKEALEAATA